MIIIKFRIEQEPEIYVETNYKAEIKMLGIPDAIIEHGSLKQLYDKCHYYAKASADAVREMMNKSALNV